MPEGPTSQQGATLGGLRPDGLWLALRSVESLLLPQGRYFRDKNPLKISARSELWISGYLRNGERSENRNAKQKRTEREIQSRRGSPPLGAMAAMDQRGNSPPIYGGGQGSRRRRGALSPSLPVAPERRRGNQRDGDLHQQLRRRQHQLSPPLCSGVTPLLPAIIST